MSHININFDGVPDKIATIPAGVYDFAIDEAPEIKDDPIHGQTVEVKHRILTEGEFKDRVLFNNLRLKYPQAQTTLKNLAQSCGVAAGSRGLDLNDFVGTEGRCRVKVTVAKPKGSDDMKEYSNVEEYLPRA